MQSRIVELESLVAHVQHDFDQINSVVVEQQRQIDELKRLMGRLEGRVEELAEAPETRDSLEERPPHY